jgi:hypothetical protein
VYRVVELSGGFGGALANNQAAFMVLEGSMVIIAVLAMTVFHPRICFNEHWETAEWKLRSKHRLLLVLFPSPVDFVLFLRCHGQ